MDLLFPRNNFLESKNTYGVWLSGGADSSILTYLLLKHIIENDLPYKLQPVSVRKYDNNMDHHLKVAQWLRDYFSTDILLPVDDNLKDTGTFSEINQRNILENKYSYIFSGITSAPPNNEFTDDWDHVLELENIRGEHAKKLLVFSGVIEQNSKLYEFGDIRPFYNLNKKNIAELYEKYNLTSTLFPVTNSCVAPVNGKHCSNCWFCNERKWAFGRI